MKIIKPTIDELIAALQSCAVDDREGSLPCENCYLYPLSQEGYLSTGESCFKHLALGVIDALRKTEADREQYKRWYEVAIEEAVAQNEDL